MTLVQDALTGPAVPLVEVVVGQRDLERPGWLQSRLEDVLLLRPAQVVVDLSGCPTLGSSALRTLLDVHCEIVRQGGALVLAGLSPRARRTVGLAGLGDVFRMQPGPAAPGDHLAG